VHSSMDFLWHVPLIPLSGAILVGVLLPPPGTRRSVAAQTKEEP
jgi:hypothetical protein